MSSSFGNDQWYNLSGEKGLSNPITNSSGYSLRSGNASSVNAPFTYPNRTVRGMGAARTPGSNVMREVRLKRGYMRGVKAEGYNPTSKCQFQFNPTMITQAMQQTAGVADWLHQPIEQFAQPAFGDTQLTFDILFDRSMELNNPNQSTVSGKSDAKSPWEKYGPNNIGVLHDLQQLYDIIGVGLSETRVEDAIKVYNQQAIVEWNALDAEAQAATTKEEFLTSTDATRERLTVNVGNTAFLVSLPIRCVFSSLYIVEGYVRGISVNFSKFNSAFVPMTCGVSVSFQAIYVGFAQKDTLFTKSFDSLLNAEATDKSTLPTNVEDLNALTEFVNTCRSEMGNALVRLADDDYSDHVTYGSSRATALTELVSSSSKPSTEYETNFGNWRSGAPDSLQVFTGCAFTGLSGNKVVNLMKLQSAQTSTPFTLTVTSSIEIFRYVKTYSTPSPTVLGYSSSPTFTDYGPVRKYLLDKKRTATLRHEDATFPVAGTPLAYAPGGVVDGERDSPTGARGRPLTSESFLVRLGTIGSKVISDETSAKDARDKGLWSTAKKAGNDDRLLGGEPNTDSSIFNFPASAAEASNESVHPGALINAASFTRITNPVRFLVAYSVVVQVGTGYVAEGKAYQHFTSLADLENAEAKATVNLTWPTLDTVLSTDSTTTTTGSGLPPGFVSPDRTEDTGWTPTPLAPNVKNIKRDVQ